jgi:choline kinase
VESISSLEDPDFRGFTRLLTQTPVRRALVLAAGNGDRFVNGAPQSKLLQCVLGRPLIIRTLTTAVAAGITRFEVVLGFQADALSRAISSCCPDLDVQFTYNPEWHLENGVSVLAARHRLADGPFALLMGDHVFDPSALTKLLYSAVGADESVLGIDRRPAADDVVQEATKVSLDGSRIVAIGKDLPRFDALDTGMFVCSPVVFDALTESQRTGDTTLSGGIRELAARGLMHGLDIGDTEWFDIDTLADLEAAESRLAIRSEQA